ncbi:AzlD domain-containing protein [Albimonas pacifica]|uniref:Branched-chain amino acid transport protein n=1 Tax=Albimonas pacifica TaxID=1114924 RepID=A0A1I3F2J8_9RHOB|nr:AzlD domain-containing protein [Albimonas pacifica]SFI05380.1 Branched-chain amino acid transport protein [Albimonas pacifica]
MIAVSDATLWAAIAALGVCTYLIRWSFIGLAGGREFPEWAMRLLRYVPVTVLPAMVAPMVVWPRALEGETDPYRILAALTVLLIGAVTGRLLLSIVSGIGLLLLLQTFA